MGWRCLKQIRTDPNSTVQYVSAEVLRVKTGNDAGVLGMMKKQETMIEDANEAILYDVLML